MGYIPRIEEQKFYTKTYVKSKVKGGFSSKLRIESLIECGHKARTHRPSPSSNKTILNIS